MRLWLGQSFHPQSVSGRTISVLRESRGHECLVDSPADADFLLFVDFASDEGFRDLLRHPEFSKGRQRAFMYNQDDIPIAFVPGLFCCTPRGWNIENRARGAHFIQPFESRHEPEERKRKHLFSFLGGPTGPFRKRLLNHNFDFPDGVIVNTAAYRHWDPNQSAADKQRFHRSYRETMLQSHFCLCPRGAGNGSIRLFEVMQMGRAPVVLADGWLKPAGPKWDDFAIFVSEEDMPHLPEILELHRGEAIERGRAARAEWEKWFRPEDSLNFLLNQVQEMIDSGVDRRWDTPLVWNAFNAIDRPRRESRIFARSVLKKLRPPKSAPVALPTVHSELELHQDSAEDKVA